MFALFRQNRMAGHHKSAFYYSSQIFVLATPFLIIPFLARVIGPAGLGLYGVGQAIALIVNTLVDYGFQINGARHVAQNRVDKILVRKMVESVFATKLVVSSACLFVGVTMLCFIVKSQADLVIFVLSILLGILQGNNLYWYFGGVDRLFLAGLIDLFAKLLSLIGIFILVRRPADLWLVFAVQFVAQFVAVTWSVALVWRHHGAAILPNWRGGIGLLSVNFEVTARSIISFLYVGSTILIISFLTSPEMVGYFSGAERIVRGAILPMAPLRQTFFPGISAMVSQDKAAAEKSVRLLLYATVTVNLMIMLIFLVGAEPIVRIALGPRFAASAGVLRILSAWPLLTGIAEVIGTLWLLPLHFDRAATKVVVGTAFVHIVGVFALSAIWLYNGAAMAMELSAAVALASFCWIVATKAPLYGRLALASRR